MRRREKRTAHKRGAFSITYISIATLILFVLIRMLLSAASSTTGLPVGELPQINISAPEGGGITSISDTGAVYVDQTSLWLQWYKNQNIAVQLFNTWNFVFRTAGLGNVKVYGEDATLADLLNYLMNTLTAIGFIAFLRRG